MQVSYNNILAPKLQVVVNVEKSAAPVQKTEWHGSNHMGNKMILTTTTESMKVNTIHPVVLDLNNKLNPKVVPASNKYTAPKGMFGTDE